MSRLRRFGAGKKPRCVIRPIEDFLPRKTSGLKVPSIRGTTIFRIY